MIKSRNLYELARTKGFFEVRDLDDLMEIIPSLEDLNYWLRNKNIFVKIDVDQTMEPKFCYSIAIYDDKTYEWTNIDPSGTALFYKYDEALAEGIEEGLKLL